MLCALQVLAQLRLHSPEHVDEHLPEHPLQPEPPPPGLGSSISQEVRMEGITIAATIGRAAVAAFLKKERLLISFLSIFLKILEIQTYFSEEGCCAFAGTEVLHTE